MTQKVPTKKKVYTHTKEKIRLPINGLQKMVQDHIGLHKITSGSFTVKLFIPALLDAKTCSCLGALLKIFKNLSIWPDFGISCFSCSFHWSSVNELNNSKVSKPSAEKKENKILKS